MEEVHQRFQTAAESEKSAVSSLPQRRRLYAAADAPGFAKAAPLNVALLRLVGSVAGPKNASFTLHEASRMEASPLRVPKHALFPLSVWSSLTLGGAFSWRFPWQPDCVRFAKAVSRVL